MNRRTKLASLVAVGLIAGASTVIPLLLTPPASGADSVGAFSASKTITRTNLNPDGTQTPVDSRTVSVHVSQTQQLRGRQDVDVSWTGAHPTGAIQPDPNGLLAPNQEYPMVVVQCRGSDSATDPSQKVDPTTCWTHGSNSRFGRSLNDPFGPWRVDRYATGAQRVATLNRPASVSTAACGSPNDEYWVPFVGVNGTSYPYGPNGCAGLPPEDFQIDAATNVPQNSTFAPTGTDGTGAVKFDVWSDAENASLGCSSTVPCSLEIIPIMGISCDPAGVSPDSSGLADADKPTAGDEQTQAATDCEATGQYAPGINAQSNRTDVAVSGNLWWSASNWRNRISVPLSFAPSSNPCDVVTTGAPVSVYGSELLVEATNQWAPYFCLDPKLFKLTHVQTAEPLARTLVANGSISAAFSSRAPDAGFPSPTVQAPVAVTGFSISYNVDDTKGHPVTNLRMTPRLLAKLLTESYASIVDVKQQYGPLKNNPVNITQDPDFEALNPGIQLSGGDAGSASLLALSGNSDVMYALTSYIEADPEARAWLAGKPDPWGMVVNPAYNSSVLSLPVDQWPLSDTFVPDLGSDNACETSDPTPYLPALASPTPTLALSALAVQFASQLSKVGCVSLAAGAGTVGQWVPEGRQQPGQRFVIGVTSLGEAQRYDLNTAALESQSTITDYSAQFSDDGGRTFVAPTNSAMAIAVGTATQDSTSETWPISYETMRDTAAGASAYPGTMVVYADIPTSGLDSATANDYANLLTFAASTGQATGFGYGQLPPGYLPMTKADGLSNFVAYTTAAAADVRTQDGGTPGHPAAAAAPTGTGNDTSSDAAGANPGSVGPDGSSPQSDAPAASNPATPAGSAVPSLAAHETTRGKTPSLTSSLAGAFVPLLLAGALLAALVAGGARLRLDWTRK